MGVFKNVNNFMSIDCLSAKLLSCEAGTGRSEEALQQIPTVLASMERWQKKEIL